MDRRKRKEGGLNSTNFLNTHDIILQNINKLEYIISKKGLDNMKRKNKIIVLISTIAIAIICIGVMGSISIKGSNKKSNVKIAKVASSSDYNTVTLEKCYVYKIDKEFNYIELQTWDFDYITINFLDDSIKSFNYDLGDNITLTNVKRKCINDTYFYFADKDTEIEVNKFNIESNINNTIPETNNIVDQIQENKDYNYKRDAD